MPNGQPIGRAGKNVCARGQNWAGLSQGMNFRAGLGGPKNITISIWAGWAAHFLMGFSYGGTSQGQPDFTAKRRRESDKGSTVTLYSVRSYESEWRGTSDRYYSNMVQIDGQAFVLCAWKVLWGTAVENGGEDRAIAVFGKKACYHVEFVRRT